MFSGAEFEGGNSSRVLYIIMSSQNIQALDIDLPSPILSSNPALVKRIGQKLQE
jgi:hypothetical protein